MNSYLIALINESLEGTEKCLICSYRNQDILHWVYFPGNNPTEELGQDLHKIWVALYDRMMQDCLAKLYLYTYYISQW